MKIKQIPTVTLMLITLLLTTYTSSAQYHSPIDYTITLAGNVGEIRSNHFHSGIDLKSLRGDKAKIYAAQNGYVSRISISPTGYGNALYITHTNGATSVYGHLHSFNETIQKYTEKQQNHKKSFATNIYLTKDKLPVKAGEHIAFMGNTGSSMGPHLHFEIRDKHNNPLNLLSKGYYHVPDNIAPTLYKVFVYQCDTIQNLPIFSLTQILEHPFKDTIKISTKSYLAYELIDYKDGRTNTMGVYAMDQKVDGKTNFSFKINHINYATSRYMNTFIQYDRQKKSRKHVIRSYVSPNNLLHIYNSVTDNGLISPNDTIQKISTTLKDDNNNSATFKFIVAKSKTQRKRADLPQNYMAIDWAKDNRIIKGDAEISIPKRALYQNEIVEILKTDTILTIGSASIALQNYVYGKIKKLVPFELQNKIVVGLKRERYIIPCTTNYRFGEISFKTRDLGQFIVTYDTIAPRIRPINPTGKVLRSDQVRFHISDDLTGIKKYNVYVDDKWVIGIYDAKYNRLYFNITRQVNPKPHQIRVEVEDKKGNKNTLNTEYKW